jgi:hypothetical protein
VQTLTFNASVANPLPASYPNVTCGAPMANAGCPVPTGAALPAPTIYVFNRNYQQPYVEQYNIGTEYQVGNSVSVSVGYLGVHGVHVQRTRDINESPVEVVKSLPVAGTGQVLSYNQLQTGLPGFPRPFAGFGRIFEFESNANSTYNGLIAQVNKRLSHNFQLSGSYTWSHVIDDSPDATAVVPGTDDGKLVYDPNNTRLDRANGNDDVRHRFVLSGVWDLNYAGGIQNPVLRGLAEGWQLAGIFNAQSGQPYTALVNSDLNNDGNNRNERAPGFARNTFNLPAIVTLDPRITRTVRITESAKLQFIGEAFNIFNHSNITGVRTTFYSLANNVAAGCDSAAASPCLVPQIFSNPRVGINAFGIPSSAAAGGQNNVGRVLQIAAKFTF